MNEQTLNWKQASIAWGEGKEIEEHIEGDVWAPVFIYYNGAVAFHPNKNYRLKTQVDVKPTVAETWKRFTRDERLFLDKGKPFLKEIDILNLMNSLHNENEDLKKDLEQVRYERGLYREMWEKSQGDLSSFIDHASSYKQPTPTQTTPNTPKEKLWCAMCGTWGDHQSGTCPEVPIASNEKGYHPVKEAIIARLERVENKLEQYFPEVN